MLQSAVLILIIPGVLVAVAVGGGRGGRGVMEFCSSNLLNVANTYFDNPPDKMATYHEPCVPNLHPFAVAAASSLSWICSFSLPLSRFH